MPATLTTPPQTTAQTKAPAKKRGFLRNVAETIVLIVVAILALEGFFTLAGIGEQEARLPDKVLGWHYPARHLVCYRREGFSHEHINTAGLRDVEHNIAKAKGVFRIALMGDSATAALQVPLQSTTARVLEKSLNDEASKRHLSKSFEVVNFGCSGYSLGQQLVLYQSKVEQYKPDMVILLYTAGDAGESVLPWSMRWTAMPRPYFYIDSKGKLREDKSIMALNDERLSPNAFWNYLECNSHIYGVLSLLDLELTVNDAWYRRFRDNVSKKLERFSKPKTVAPDAMPELYFAADRVAVGKALLTELNERIAADHGRLVVYCFPNCFDNKEFYEDAKIFAPFAREQGIPFLDLDKPYKESSDPTSLILQQHFSVKGHAFATGKLMQLIEPLCFSK